MERFVIKIPLNIIHSKIDLLDFQESKHSPDVGFWYFIMQCMYFGKAESWEGMRAMLPSQEL